MRQGNGWPNPEQKLLLQACLLSGADAQNAWARWKSRIDLNTLEHASHKLLPLVCRNPSIAMLTDPILEKCRGYYRKTWLDNHINWKQTLSLLLPLSQQHGTKIILLKGIAMILAYYEDFGVRPIGDVDILLQPKDLSLAKSAFLRDGIKQHDPRLNLESCDQRERWHAMSFVDKSGRDIDLHWSFIHEQDPSLDKAVWEGAQPLPSCPSVYIPAPTHLLLQTCIHGSKHSPIPLIRWVSDAMTLIKKAPIDWDELVFLSNAAKINLPMAQALNYLQAEFSAPIPSSAIHALSHAPTHWLQIREDDAHRRGRTYLAEWYRFCLRRNLRTLTSQILNLHKYLQCTARLRSPWHIPFFALYWISKRLKILYTNALKSWFLSASKRRKSTIANGIVLT